MNIDYLNKKTEAQIISAVKTINLIPMFGDGDNMLIQGDNLRVLKTLATQYHLKNKIDLVYIDPPFATNGNFTIGDERVSTISNSKKDKLAYSDSITGYEFLEFLRERLIFIKELLSEQGSIYLHIDYKIGHYVKIIMDEIFGIENFRNDITRIKCNPKNFKRKAYGNIKDLILFYSKSKNSIWNEPTETLTQEDIKTLFKKVDSKGRRYTTIPLHAPGETENGATGGKWQGQLPPKGRHWRTHPNIMDEWDKQGLIEWSKNGNPRKIIFADDKKGKKKQDIWHYKDYQYPIYPTEKNSDLLEDIINASSNKDSVVMDCFCGSGTTLVASQKLGRKWIGIDQSQQAIRVTQQKLYDMPYTLFDNNNFRFLEATNIRKKPNISDNINKKPELTNAYTNS